MPETGDDVSPDDPVDAVGGVGPARSETLASEGYETVGDLQEANMIDLAEFLPDNVARSINDQVGDVRHNFPDVNEAKKKARQIPGAKAKQVTDGEGHKTAKVLRKEQEFHVGGATVEIHKG